MNFFCSFSVLAIVFKLWWLIAYVVMFVPVIGNLLYLIVMVVGLGTCYIKMYVGLDGKDEKDVQLIGYLPGLLPLIALDKFLAGKYDV